MYRPDLQGLRALAVSMVVLAHFGVPGLAGGFVGVDVFFVLSGYLITRLLLSEFVNSGGIRFVRFISRRLKRLLPALLVMLISVASIASLLLTDHEGGLQSGSFTYAATWTSNLYFALANFDYFSPLQAKDLYLHTWSLGVEEQFYLVWPMLILLALAVLPRRIGSDAIRRRMLSALGVVAIGAFALSIYWSQTQTQLAFYMMPSRAWQFALGALVTVYFRDYEITTANSVALRIAYPLGAVIAWTGIILILGSTVLLHRQLAYPGYYALFPSIGAALVIASANLSNTQGVRTALTSKPMVWLGDRSYSIYLWHWPVLLLATGHAAVHPSVEKIFLIALSAGLATFSYKWVELPIWKGPLSATMPGRSILVSTLAVLIVISTVHGARTYSYGEDIAGGLALDYDARYDGPPVYGQGCDGWYHNSTVRPCFNTETDTPSTVVLLGDSIGVQWYSMLTEIYRLPNWRVVTLTKSGCAIVDVDYFYRPVGRDYRECTDWGNASLNYVSSLEPDVVFIGSSSSYDFSDQQWIEGSFRVLNRLSPIAGQVVVLAGTPAMSFNGPTCLSQKNDGAACAETLTDATSGDVADKLAKAVGRFENSHVIDLADLVCPDYRCAALDEDGIVVFRDKQHLTDRFVRSRVPALRNRLTVIGATPDVELTAN